jgi:hypothetical protein
MQIDSFSEEHAFWPKWAEFLCSRGLERLAIWALEAAEPINVIGAQLLYMGGSLLNPVFSKGQIEALASLLEDRDETNAFISFLREGVNS